MKFAIFVTRSVVLSNCCLHSYVMEIILDVASILGCVIPVSVTTLSFHFAFVMLLKIIIRVDIWAGRKVEYLVSASSHLAFHLDAVLTA